MRSHVTNHLSSHSCDAVRSVNERSVRCGDVSFRLARRDLDETRSSIPCIPRDKRVADIRLRFRTQPTPLQRSLHSSQYSRQYSIVTVRYDIHTNRSCNPTPQLPPPAPPLGALVVGWTGARGVRVILIQYIDIDRGHRRVARRVSGDGSRDARVPGRGSRDRGRLRQTHCSFYV